MRKKEAGDERKEEGKRIQGIIMKRCLVSVSPPEEQERRQSLPPPLLSSRLPRLLPSILLPPASRSLPLFLSRSLASDFHAEESMKEGRERKGRMKRARERESE